MFGQATQIASLFARIGADTSSFDRAMRGADRKLGGVSSSMKLVGKVAAGVAVAGVTALGAAIGSSLAAAKEFDQVMSGAKAVLGATDETMGQLTDTALRLGKETAFSAAEAAGAIEMLAKNGLSASQILGGAADATVALAAATGADLRTAADVATDAMASFNIRADQMATAINGISAVTVNSKFDINDYALALAQGGGVAASVGVSFADFNTTIAAISPLFASGSDAGTSFKTFLQRLVPASNPASDAMKRLGLMTEDGANAFFDSAGKMKSMANIAGILQDALGGLSDEQKTQALSTIFGTDSMRAAAALAGVGRDKFMELADSMSQVDAQAQALTRLDNLAGDMEQLSGSIETVRIKAGRAFTPLARTAVRLFTDQVNRLIDLDWNGIVSSVTDFGRSFAGIFSGPGSIFALGGRGIWDELVRGWRSTGSAFGAMMELLDNWLSEDVVGALWNFYDGLRAAFGGFKDAALGAVQSAIKWIVSDGVPLMVRAAGKLATALVGWAGSVWTGIGGGGGLLGKLGELWNNIVAWVQNSPMLDTLSVWKDAFVSWAFVTGMTLRGKLATVWDSVRTFITDPKRRADMAKWLGEKWDGFATWASGIWERDVKPPLLTVGASINTWLEQNAPSLKVKIDSTFKFAEGLLASVKGALPEVTTITQKFATDMGVSLGSIVASWGELIGLFSGPGRAQWLGDWSFSFVTMYEIVTTTVSGILTAMDALIQTLVILAGLGGKIRSGDLAGIGDAMDRFRQIVEGFQGTLIEDIAKWMDPLYWLGIRPDNPSQSNGAQGQSFSPSSFGTNMGGITINVSADAIPTDRAKIQELARLLWREAELAGMRVT